MSESVHGGAAQAGALRTWMYRLLLGAGLPLAVVGLAEGTLRAARGGGLGPLARVATPDGVKVASQAAYGEALFPLAAGPALPPLWVPEAKDPGEVRIVVLGESAAEGFPLPAFSLARVLETVLKERNPGLNARVVSLAMTGIDSHQIRRLGRAAAERLDPDIVVIYAGNNEVIGPCGPAAAWAPFRRHLGLIRLQGWLREWQLARALDRLSARGRAAGAPAAWRGLDEFQAVRIAADDPRLETMYGHFRRNLEDLVRDLDRRDIRVAVCTMGVNLTDWPPLGSEEGTAGAADPPGGVRSAQAAYRRAEEQAAAGATAAAWTWYRRACDLDTVRFRADSRINGILRELGGRGPAERVRLVDVDRALHEGQGEPGADGRWFFEHVHLTLDGRVTVAGWIADALDGAGWIAAPRGKAPEGAAVRPALAVVPRDEWQGWLAVREFYRWPLFAGQAGAAERTARLEKETARLRQEWTDWNPGRVRALREAARERHPADPWRDATVGGHLLALEDAAGARELLEEALRENPGLGQARADAARACLKLHDGPAARQHLEAGLARQPNDPVLRMARGEWALQAGRLDEAETDLEAARQLRPRDLRILILLARVAEARGDWTGAARHYRAGLEIDPDSPHLLNNLALALLVDPGAREEACRLAQRAVDREPESPHVWLTLARARAAEGQVSAALEALERAEELARKGGHSELRETMASMRRRLENAAPAKSD